MVVRDSQLGLASGLHPVIEMWRWPGGCSVTAGGCRVAAPYRGFRPRLRDPAASCVCEFRLQAPVVEKYGMTKGSVLTCAYVWRPRERPAATGEAEAGRKRLGWWTQPSQPGPGTVRRPASPSARCAFTQMAPICDGCCRRLRYVRNYVCRCVEPGPSDRSDR